MCPPGYDQSFNGRKVTHALGHLYTFTHCWNQWNKEVSTSLAKMYYAHLIYVGFEHSLCHESLLNFRTTKYKKICFVNLNDNQLMKKKFSTWLVFLRDYPIYVHLIYTSVYLYLYLYIKYIICIYIYVCITYAPPKINL